MNPLGAEKTQAVENIKKCVENCQKLCSEENKTPFDDAIKLLNNNLDAIKEECGKILE